MSDTHSALEDIIINALADQNESGTVTLFIQLLRESPCLRHWLESAFMDAGTRSRLLHYIAGKISPPRHASQGSHLLAWLAKTDGAFEVETIALARKHASVSIASYGGLTRAHIMQLIRRHQAGSIDLASFLLAHAWRKTPQGMSPRAALLLMSGRYLQAGFREDTAYPNFLRHLARAAEFFHNQPQGTITRAHYGYANWWKLCVLHYMLNHPKPYYRTRDFVRHLVALKITVDTKDIRRFCTRHGITRDTQPGRPRNSTKISTHR